jgi:protocatechuate 3,4-dioxygenase beta subunit
MKHCLWLLLAIGLPACGGDGPGGRGKPARSDFRPEDVLITAGEWYRLAPDVIPTVRVLVTDPEGNPLPGATVRRVAMPRLLLTPPLVIGAPGTTDSMGRFTAESLPLNCWLLAEKDGFAATMIPPMLIGPIRGEEVEIGLRVPGKVHGVARFKDGAMVPGCDIMAVTADNDWFGLAKSDGAGVFRFDAAPPGEILVFVVPGNLIGRAPGITLPPGEEREVTVEVLRTPPTTGRVVDEATGAPIPGAVVRTLSQNEGGCFERYVLTGDDGRFVLEGAHSGGFFVHADGYGEVAKSFPPQQPPESLVVELAPAMSFTGRVVDAKGKPVAGVRVCAYPRPEKPGSYTQGPLSREDGTFAINWGAAPPEGSRGVIVVEASRHLLGFSDPIDFLRGGRRDGVVVRLSLPSAFKCRMVDEAGEAWAHAPILLSRVSEDLPAGIAVAEPGQISLFTDSEGRLDLRALRAGDFRLTVNVPHRVAFEKTFPIEAESLSDLGDVVMPRGLAIAGKIADPAGTPLAGILIQLTPEAGGVPITIPIDDKGAFRLFGFTPGRHVLMVSSRLHETVRQSVESGTEDLDILLTPLAQLVVRLSGLPAEHPDGVVEIERLDAPRDARTLVREVFRQQVGSVAFGNLPRGLYRLRARVVDWHGQAEIRISGNPRASLEIPVVKGATISGRVVNAAGQAIGGAMVDVDAGDVFGRWNLETGTTGDFRIAALGPGEVTLRSRPEGYPEGAVAVRIEGEETLEVDLVLPEGAAVEIRAATPAGVPVENLEVWLRDPEGEVEPFWVEGGGRARTDQRGLLKLVGVLPGVYTLNVSQGADVIDRRRIRLSPGETLPVVLEVGH